MVAVEGFVVSHHARAFREVGKIEKSEADKAKSKEMTAQRK
jgi:hypothetical protein